MDVYLSLTNDNFLDDGLNDRAFLFELEVFPRVIERFRFSNDLSSRSVLNRQEAKTLYGSRKADPYGIEVAEKFAGELAAAGLTVVSGLALGVDSAAHQGALAMGGQTVAVLGCGIDVDYPRSNRRLRARMAESGAIVTEFPIGTAPEPHHFPIRNCTVALLSRSEKK